MVNTTAEENYNPMKWINQVSVIYSLEDEKEASQETYKSRNALTSHVWL